MDPATLTNIALVVVPAIGAVIGYVLSNITKKIDRMEAELRSTQRKEDATREVDRIDRDINNLRDDVSRGFDRLYETLSENKKELLAAIQSLRGK